MVLAKFIGSFPSSGSGRPWPTSQNGQRRVHLSPMIMKVAVPLPKHSPMLGHEASSQTVTSLLARSMSLISPKRELGELALTRIQSGFFNASPVCTTLTGMRDTLSEDFCLTPAS